MILDKLLEKKDIIAFIAWRIRLLEFQLFDIPKITDERKREPAKRHLKGRIDELKFLKTAFKGDVKRQSMLLCADFHKKRRMRGTPWEDSHHE